MKVLRFLKQSCPIQLETYQRTLRNVGETISRPRKVGHGTLMWDTSHHLIYCPIYKVNSCHTVECLEWMYQWMVFVCLWAQGCVVCNYQILWFFWESPNFSNPMLWFVVIFKLRWQVAPGQQTSSGSPPSTQTCPSGRDTQNNMMQGAFCFIL